MIIFMCVMLFVVDYMTRQNQLKDRTQALENFSICAAHYYVTETEPGKLSSYDEKTVRDREWVMVALAWDVYRIYTEKELAVAYKEDVEPIVNNLVRSHRDQSFNLETLEVQSMCRNIYNQAMNYQSDLQQAIDQLEKDISK